MTTIELVRRGETIDEFPATPGNSLFAELLARHVPPSSAVVTVDDEPRSPFVPIAEDTRYVVELLEGYDVDRLRGLYDCPADPGTAHTSRVISFDDGEVTRSVDHLDAAGLVEHVEELTRDTIEHYDLVSPGDRLLVALSGESDSSAMLLALDALAEPSNVELAAVTIREPRGAEDDAFQHAAALTDELDIEHHTVDLADLESLYGMEGSIRTAFDGLAESAFADRSISVLETVHRRAFEAVAEREGYDRICTGKYLTEFVAGILNSTTSGVRTRDVPKARVGDVTYTYPMVYLDKAELALYHRFRTGSFAPTSRRNMWETTPDDHGFLYYLADVLRSYWPGIGYWLVEEQRRRAPARSADDFDRCANCGKYVLADPIDSDRCLACRAFAAVGAL